MSLKSDSITWQSWARKWGDWRTWFPKINGLREPMQRDLRFRVVALEKPLESTDYTDWFIKSVQSVDEES